MVVFCKQTSDQAATRRTEAYKNQRATSTRHWPWALRQQQPGKPGKPEQHPSPPLWSSPSPLLNTQPPTTHRPRFLHFWPANSRRISNLNYTATINLSKRLKYSSLPRIHTFLFVVPSQLPGLRSPPCASIPPPTTKNGKKPCWQQTC